MSPAPMSNLDLMAPPVVKTIQQRSLMVGLVFQCYRRPGRLASPTNSSAPT